MLIRQQYEMVIKNERIKVNGVYHLLFNLFAFFLIAIIPIGCNEGAENELTDTEMLGGSLFQTSLKIGPFRIKESFTYKSFSFNERGLYGYANSSKAEVFDVSTGQLLLSHDLKASFGEPIGEINSFVIDSLNYLIQTNEKLYVFNEEFRVIDLQPFLENSLVLENLTYPAFSSKHDKLCAPIISYQDKEQRSHLYDYKHLAMIDLKMGKLDILDIKYPETMGKIGNHIIPYTYVTYYDGYFTISASMDDQVYIVNAETSEIQKIEAKSRFGSTDVLSVSGNPEISKAKNQEFGFKYRKAWYNHDSKELYRLVMLPRQVKKADGTFSNANDQPHSLIKIALGEKENEILERKLANSNIGQDMEIFYNNQSVCHRSNYVLSKADTTWNFIFNCYSIH